MTGYDLLTESAHIIAMLEAPEGADADALDSRLSAWLADADDKIGAYHAVCERLDAEDELLKKVADRIAAKRKYLAANKSRVRSMATEILIAMEGCGEEPKVKRPEFTAYLQASEAVEVGDEKAIPPDLVKVTVAPDKTLIKAAIKSGREVPGASIVTSRSVRFK